MSLEVDVTSFNAALAKLRAEDASVIIGFNTNYAAAVHERLDLHHEPPGQAKFLESALREAGDRGLVEKSIGIQVSAASSPAAIPAAVDRGILRAGLAILSNAQQKCPIDTGALAASATWQGTGSIGSGSNPGGVSVSVGKAKA